MPRATASELEHLSTFIERLQTMDAEGPEFEEQLEILRRLRSGSGEVSENLDVFLLQRCQRLQNGLESAGKSQEKLKALLEELTAPPLHPGVYLGTVENQSAPAALVAHGATRRVVGFAEGVAVADLALGDEVLLGHELNVILQKAPADMLRCGEIAQFERWTSDGRAVLRSRDEQLVVLTAAGIGRDDLVSGDLVRWDRSCWIVLEKVERSDGGHLFMEESPEETFAAIGGLDRQVESLQGSIRLHRNHRETVRKYGLRRKGSVLLVGPPGTGKTMMARALANWLGRISGSGRARFMNLKPAALHSSWYAQSEANYREAFKVAREAGKAEPDVPVVMFFDEVDALGAARGDSRMRVDDRVLTAFMTELDGLEERGNILVVAATNRRDALDPALLRPGRLGDLVLEVPRPNMDAAREIFAKYLPEGIPYAAAAEEAAFGEEPEAVSTRRQRLIEAAVSRIYAPNADNALATLTFRDGRQRVVEARDLISGATIAKVAQAAIETACMRELESGLEGLRPEDILSAIAEEAESMARSLTPANCRKHLGDLPDDVDVARLDPIERRVAQPHRYLSVA